MVNFEKTLVEVLVFVKVGNTWVLEIPELTREIVFFALNRPV